MSSRLVLGTSKFDAMVSFYADRLCFPITDQSELTRGRRVLIELPGILLEVFDNDSEPSPSMLGASLDRIQLVIEVDDLDKTRDLIDLETPIPHFTQSGARRFQIRDPDGLPIIFTQRNARNVMMGGKRLRNKQSTRSK